MDINDKQKSAVEPDETHYDNINKLKLAVISGKVVKGIKETLRAVTNKQAKLVFYSKCETEGYNKVLEEFCKLYKIQTVEVESWLTIRDIVMREIPSSVIIEKAKRLGRTAKITPKCFCAAIIEFF